MNIRDFIGAAQGLAVDVDPPEQRKLAVKDQVVIRRPVGFSGATNEILVGEITAFADDKNAYVSFPRPGGVLSRSLVSVDQLQPATSVYSRGRVNINPGFRGQM